MPRIRASCALRLLGIVLIITSPVTPQNDCLFGSETGCAYPCHCVNNEACNADTGACANGCDPGDLGTPIDDLYQGAFEGYGCQIGNVAYSQSAANGPLTFDSNSGSRATDGNHDPSVAGLSCAYAKDDGTFNAGGEAWWTVTLDADYVITSLVVTPSTGSTRDLLSNTAIDVTLDSVDESAYRRCADIGALDSGPNTTVTCSTPMHGRFVRLKRLAGADMSSELVVCEVHVVGYLYKACYSHKWGVACSLPCNCEDPCDNLDGTCPSNCNLGWSGDNCQTETSGNSGGGVSNSIIIGVVVLVILLLIIVSVVAFLVLRRKKLLGKQSTSWDSITGMEDGDSGARGVEETVLGTVSSRPVTTRDLADYIYSISHRSDGFKKEYMQVGAAAGANAGKGRGTGFTNGAMENDDYDYVNEKFRYIDASYLKGYPQRPQAFVISPAPVKGITESFWRMVFETKAACVISFMTPEEHEEESCWPSGGQTEFGGYKLVLRDDVRAFIHCRSSDLTVTYKGNTHHCKYLQYTAWPSRVEPTSAGSLLNFWRRARQYTGADTNVSIVFSGPGLDRAGTYIALDYCLQQAENEAMLDACAYAVYMRTLRQDMELQLKQYKFLYTATHEHAQCIEAMKSKKKDVEFKVLDKIKPVYSNQDIEDMSGNANPLAVVDPASSVDAVFVDGPRSGRAFITASFQHTPSEQNLADFWQLMVEQKSSTLVVLAEVNEESMKYWPHKTDVPLQAGKVTVRLEKETATKHYTVRELAVSVSTGQSARVRQFHSAAWPDYSKLPSSSEALRQLVTDVHAWGQESGGGPVTIACSTGYHQSGVVCAALYLLNMAPGDAAAVFQAVKTLRLSRPEFIENQAEYKFLCDFSSALMKR